MEFQGKINNIIILNRAITDIEAFEMYVKRKAYWYEVVRIKFNGVVRRIKRFFKNQLNFD